MAVDETIFFGDVRSSYAEVLAEISGAKVLRGNPFQEVSGTATLLEADASSIAFLANTKYKKDASSTQAGICIASPSDVDLIPEHVTVLSHTSPYFAFATIIHALYPSYKAVTIDSAEDESISSQADISETATIGHHVIINDNAVIEDDVVIGAHSVIGKGVRIGRGTTIAPSCVIECAHIGEECEILTGARIGQEGFGFATSPEGKHITVPQIGAVIIGDHVHIGANTCIDRGSLQHTLIDNDARIDNLVQIGHNVSIGKGAIIIAQAGIAGSSSIGNFSVLAGQVGVSGHVTIADYVMIAAQSGVAKDITKEGSYGGSPAVPIQQYHRQHLFLKKYTSAMKKKPAA